MKNFLKGILSVAAIVTVLGGIWMYISKTISEEDLEEDFDEDFDNIDEFEDEEDDLKNKKRGYFTLKREETEANA